MPMNENPESLVSVPDITLTPTAKQHLDQTRPWVKFMSIMLFITSAFMIVMSILMVTVGLGPRFTPPGQGRLGSFGALGFMANLVGAFFYILLAILYVAPGVFLWRYAGAIKLLELSRSPEALEEALENQKSFWRYIGILTVTGLILAATLIAVSLVVVILFVHR
jgi:vacuolar-type H+-ATPase subunit I/STV1